MTSPGISKTALLASDGEQTPVQVELTSYDSKKSVVMTCVVHSHNGEAFFVSFPEGWRRLAQAVELDAHSVHTEGFIWTEAVRAWQRRA